MSQHPFKPILLDLLRYARLAQDAFVEALDPAERAAIGTPDHWSAKDHVAHMTFWRQQLIPTVRAVLRHETPTRVDDYERLNPVIFERERQRPWSEILAESDHAYDELIALADQLGDDDLTAFQRFNWIPDGWPLYTAFMGNCYEHAQQHLAQYALDRHDLPGALSTCQVWVERVVQTEAPDALKGYVLYDLACFYATHGEEAQALTTARRAFTLHPPLKDFAHGDPDLDAVRSHSPEAFS
jgi:hypothetical protein